MNVDPHLLNAGLIVLFIALCALGACCLSHHDGHHDDPHDAFHIHPDEDHD